jgi:hypothetical protein
MPSRGGTAGARLLSLGRECAAGVARSAALAIMDTYSDDFRYHAEFRLTAACMRYKGYEQVPVQ